MASPATLTIATDIEEVDTDYGSDFSLPEEELILEKLLRTPATEEDNPIVNNVEQYDTRQNLRVPRIFGREERSPLFQAARAAEQVAKQISQSVGGGQEGYPDLSKRLHGSEKEVINSDVSMEDVMRDGPPDTRSPLERFRTRPKKALSVTDLVSPAWCELQYWYTLTKHGRKKRTPAMKQGSAVHQKLEDQVHTTVRVDVESKEDAWGLRIWNVIQGLRTLRDTGLTRELEIWGTIDGLVVNGVIDELSYVCPNTELENSQQKNVSANEPASDQATISDFFKAAGGQTIAQATRSNRRSHSKKIYICDVKTRGVKSLPNAASFRPTKVQLMLYHRLLASLATNTVDFSVLTTRYNLDSSKVFSDSFIAQVGSLNEQLFYDAPESQNSAVSGPTGSQDSMSVLLAHNTLSALWPLMISEFQLTLPDGADSLGRVLKAEYRSRDTGEIVGGKEFAMNDDDLTTFIGHEMEWWKGERGAEGVVVEEAFKCRSCDFADGCEWRLRKVEEAKEKVRMSRKRTAVV